MTNRELLKRLQELETAERDVASSMDMPQENTANWAYAETAAIARSAILQYQEEIERLQGERAAAIDRLTPLGCERNQFRKALEMIRDGQIPQAMSPALFAESVLEQPVPQPAEQK